MSLTSQIYKLWEFPDLFSANFKLLGLRRQAGALTATQICRLPLNSSPVFGPSESPRNLGVLANTLKSKRGQRFLHGQYPQQNPNVSQVLQGGFFDWFPRMMKKCCNGPFLSTIWNKRYYLVYMSFFGTRCQIWGTIELHRDPISKVLSEW